MNVHEITAEQVNEITKKLVDEGRIIAAGFAGMRLRMIPVGTPPEQVAAMERAYLGGAQHLWASIFAALDADNDPTPADIRRMALISAELDAWSKAENLSGH